MRSHIVSVPATFRPSLHKPPRAKCSDHRHTPKLSTQYRKSATKNLLIYVWFISINELPTLFSKTKKFPIVFQIEFKMIPCR